MLFILLINFLAHRFLKMRKRDMNRNSFVLFKRRRDNKKWRKRCRITPNLILIIYTSWSNMTREEGLDCVLSKGIYWKNFSSRSLRLFHFENLFLENDENFLINLRERALASSYLPSHRLDISNWLHVASYFHELSPSSFLT